MSEINGRTKQATKITWIAFTTNITLVFFKLSAGLIGKSAAMIADSIHSISDLITDIVVLWGFKIVDKPADEDHDYGHGKFETLAATIVGVILLVVGSGILWSGFKSIYNAVEGVIVGKPGWIALIAAIVSILAKELLYRYSIKVGKAINSQAIIANAWHQRSDSLSSVATMFGIGGAILLGDKWHILDPIAAVIVSFLIIKVGIEVIINSIKELLETSLNEEMENNILTIAKNVVGVKNPHKLKTRMLGNNIVVDIHIEVSKELNITEAHNIATRVEERLKTSFGKETFVSIHVEPAEAE